MPSATLRYDKKPEYRTGGANHISQFVWLVKVIRRVVILTTGAHIKRFAAVKQPRGGIHLQRHLACGGLHQPVEIDKISSTDKAQWIEEFYGVLWYKARMMTLRA